MQILMGAEGLLFPRLPSFFLPEARRGRQILEVKLGGESHQSRFSPKCESSEWRDKAHNSERQDIHPSKGPSEGDEGRSDFLRSIPRMLATEITVLCL